MLGFGLGSNPFISAVDTLSLLASLGSSVEYNTQHLTGEYNMSHTVLVDLANTV